MGGRIMKLLLIAKSNAKKKKNNMILIFVLVLISTMLLYTGLNVISNVNKFLDKRNEEQNGADFMMICSDGFTDEINNILKDNSAYKYSEEEKSIVLLSSTIRNITKESKKESYTLLMLNLDENRKISNLDILNKGEELSDNSIVLPAYLKISKGFNVGDKVEVTNGSKKYIFEVYGFTEDVMFSNPSNVTMFKCFVNNNIMEKIKAEDSSALPQSCYNVKLKEGYATDEYESYVSDKLTTDIKDPKFMANVIINYDTMKSGTSIFVNIMMAIISIFAAIIVLISIIVIRFSINTSIESNIQNIGILEAIGYTSKQLIVSTVIEYLSISIIGSILGIMVSYFASNFISNVVSSAIGLSWVPNADIILIVSSLVAINICVFLVSFISANRYKKITPLLALRSGISSHNFKKNYMPLSKGKIGLNSSLGIKEIMHNKKQNISMVIIVMLLSFTCVLSVGIYYNFAANQQSLINIVGMEKPNILISASQLYSGGNDDEIYNVFDEIERRDDVENTLYYSEQKGNLINGENNVSLDLEVISEIDKLKVNTLLDGRLAKHDNEIMITNVVLKKLNAKLGDTIYIEALGERKEFVIVGITQQIPQMGVSAKISEDGMKRLYKDFKLSLIHI